MLLRRAAYQNFRNLQGLDLKFHQGFIVLAGPNGAGKTNFLEGLYFGSTLRHFPDSQLAQLFLEGQDYFHLTLEAENAEAAVCEIHYERQEAGYRYQLKRNGQALPRAKFAGQIPMVSFLPQDLNLLTHSPARRRYFLNEALGLVSAEYRYNQQQYEKALRQRNKLWQKIASGEAREDELGIWDETLAEFGSQLLAERGEFLKFMNIELPKILNLLAPFLTNTEFIYEPSGFPEKAAFLARLEELRERERQVKTTGLGPHRDDFKTKIDGREAVGYLSRGQLRAVTLALKMAERKYLEEKTTAAPIILLDDVFSEFDSTHQQHLLKFLENFRQIFITTTHLEEIRPTLPAMAEVYAIEKGKIERL